MKTNFFRNDDLVVFLIGHVTDTFYCFSQNEDVIRRETNETLICCTIAEILVDFYK